jgi:hypothetical protein
MKVQIRSLPFGEVTDVDRTSRLDSHPLKRGKMRYRRDDETAGMSKVDESAVNQVIDAGGQEQAVFTIEAFFVGCIAPRFAVAGDHVNRVVNAGNSASPLNRHHTLFEDALSTPRADDCFAVRFPDGCIGGDSLLKPVFPDIKVVARGDSIVRGAGRLALQVSSLASGTPQRRSLSIKARPCA